MIHSSYYKPKIFPIYNDGTPTEIDRLQDLTGTTTLDRTKIQEIGRDGLVDWRKGIPTVSLTLRQIEYGSLEFFIKLANVADNTTKIEFTDFKTTAVDIAGYKTDDDGTFLGTIRYPGLRLSAFGVSIGDPDALIERSFTLVGENEMTLINDNKYLIYKRYTISAGQDQTVTVDDPDPEVDPDNSGQYLFRVTRTRAGTTTVLPHGTGWSYDGAGTLTINGTSEGSDIIRVWYSAGDYIGSAPENIFELNDTDLAGISADSCSIFIESSNYLYRLQSVALDTTLDRFDIKEIGDKNIVARGVRDITNRVTLGRILENYTIEEVIRGKAGLSYGKIDVREFSDELNLIIKIYEDDTKSAFKIGYKLTDLAPVGVDTGTPVNDYVTRGVTLEGEEGFITTAEGDL